ncbi:MAG: glycosyl hydrolase [Acidobacteria bacterium]|nr:glycosyl hydrolase [Acidobacteriota bacterium]
MTRLLLRSLPALALLITAGLGAQEIDPDKLGALRYRFIGPDGNRAIAVAGVPGNDKIVYAGAASGGIWKTTNGGRNWQPIFDATDVASVGSLAIAPSDPNIVWAGTGETFVIRPALAHGDGIYRSTDAGSTWQHMGLDATGRIGRVVIDPVDPNIVFACALGHGYADQPERGIYRTVDGGRSWELVLHVDEATGCADLVMDPSNRRVLVAGMWQLRMDLSGLQSGGPSSGVYRSRDGGETWQMLSGTGRGLPGGESHPVGKLAVGIAQSDSDRWYVLTEDTSPAFYRSDNAGDSWRLVNTNHTLNERAPYYTRFGIDTADADRIYITAVRFSMSVDGGHTLVPNPPRGGGDTHDVWIDPLDANRVMVADDGGINISLNRGRSFERIVLPIAQMYHVEVDNEVPYRVYGNRQDGYSYRGPSNSRTGSIPLRMWQGVGGCESGWATPDPSNSNVVWSGCYDGGLEVYDAATGHWRDVRVWPEAAYGWAPANVRYRWHWNFPLEISPHDTDTVYVGSQFVHRTTNGGQSWEEISPDLTTNDKARQQDSGGGLTIDNLYTWTGAVLFSIAESPVEEGLLWVGSNDGRVHVSRNGGDSWDDVSANVPGLYVESWIKGIEPSRYDAGTAYMAVSNHVDGDFDPHIFRTTDYGASWQRISAGIEASAQSFVHVVREDPRRPGMLYAGTDNQIWVTLDDGDNWFPLRTNMPPAPIYWLTLQEQFDDLIVATYGRGFYILDDLGALRALDAGAIGSDFTAFESRPAYRFQSVQGIKTESGSNVTGRNPAYGTGISYWLGDGMAGQPVAIEIQDSAGAPVRTLRGTSTAGLNRVMWNLRYEGTREPKLRTPPPDHDWVPMGEEGWRRLRTWDLDLFPGYRGALAVPGSYTAVIRAGDVEQSIAIEVIKDPNSAGTPASIDEQFEMTRQLHSEINEIADMIDQLEWTRKELLDLAVRHGDDEAYRAVLQSADELESYALSIEARLFDVNLTGAREDAFRAPMKLYGRYGALTNDVAHDSADFRPTDQQREVHAVLQARLVETRQMYRKLMDEDAPAFRAMLQRAQ